MVHDLLEPADRARALLVIGTMIVAATVDVLGVASIMPFVHIASRLDEVDTLPVVGDVYRLLGFESPQAFMVAVGVAVLALLLAALAFRAFTLWVQVRFSARRRHLLSMRLFRKYLGESYEWFLGRHSSEIASSVLDESMRAIDQSLFPLLQLCANGMVVAGLVGMLLFIDPVLAVGAVVILGGSYLLAFMGFQGLNRRVGVTRQESNRTRFRVVQEAFGGFKELKLLGLEQGALDRFEGPSSEVARADGMQQALSETPRFAMQGIISTIMILAVIYVLQTRGSLDSALPILAGFAFAGYRLLPSLQTVYAQVMRLRFSAPALMAVHRELAERRPSRAVLPWAVGTSATPIVPEQRIALSGVRYSYPGSPEPSLRGLDIEIPVRSTVGIVGGTGAGKTTAVDVLLGLLQPQSGALVVDGRTIGPEQLRAWQRSVGYVPQTIYLADDTVAANIAFGVAPEDIDRDAVERAARIANLHQFVQRELPNGYDTVVGERGIRLSGGQRQRIGIARALYRDPAVLVMDEATSALDNVTERAVMEAIDHLDQHKTIILIAHRLTTVRRSSRIFVMSEGRCVASGNWDELSARDETFMNLVSAVS
jgi:ABC-type multidrug transport system fused ATPase/permease subunit